MKFSHAIMWHINVYAHVHLRENENAVFLVHFSKLKIPEQTEPPFRGKLNQMLKDGFAGLNIV